MKTIIEFLKPREQIALQSLNRQFYTEHIPGAIKSIYSMTKELRQLGEPKTMPDYDEYGIDHGIHEWTLVHMPFGWSCFYSGAKLSVSWNDQGWGN